MNHPFSVSSEKWRSIIQSGAKRFGQNLDASTMDRICRFGEELLLWNRKTNLTTITHPEEMAIKHFVDSMAAAPHIDLSGTLLDIGSGGGFPGIVLGILNPALEVHSIDKVRKKISFQQHLVRTLQLKNVVATHQRAQELFSLNPEVRFDAVVSRALGSMEMFYGLSRPMVAHGGKIIAYRGQLSEEDQLGLKKIEENEAGLKIDVHSYCLDGFADSRHLIIIQV